jgi:hypothetical protein
MVRSDIGAEVQMVTKSTDAISWRNASALIKGERLVAHNLIVGGGSIAASLLDSLDAIVSAAPIRYVVHERSRRLVIPDPEPRPTAAARLQVYR